MKILEEITENTGCLLCAGKSDVRYRLDHIWHQPQDLKEYQIRWCASCDLGFIYPQPTVQELNYFYGSEYYARNVPNAKNKSADSLKEKKALELGFLDRVRLYFAWRSDKSYRNISDFIIQIAGNSSLYICDIGCGAGNLLLQLKNFGYKCVGVEIDEAALVPAKAKGLAIYSGSAENMPKELANESFDLITMTHVLEHCINPVKGMENAIQLVKPGGKVIVEVPNNSAYIAHDRGVAWFHCDAGRHLYFFTEKSLRLLFAKCGLEVSTICYSGYHSQFTNLRFFAEQRILDMLFENKSKSKSVGIPLRDSKWGFLKKMVYTMFRRDEIKYELITIVGSTRL